MRNLRDGKLKRVGRRSTALGFQRPAANPVISNRGRVAVYASSGRTAGVHVANTRANRRTTLFRRRQSFQGGLSVSGNGRVAAWTTVGTSGDRVSVSVYRSSTSAHKRRLVARFRAQCCLSESRVYGTSLSANGDRLAYTALRKGRYYVLVYSARTGRSRVLGRGMYPSMSADGGRVAYSRASTTMYVRRVTGNRLLSRVRHALTGALSPDGHWLAYVASGSRQQAFVRRIK